MIIALDQLVRVALQQQAVLERARLHLVGVDDQVLRARRVLAHRHEAPLLARREARAAAARAGSTP